MNTLCFVLLMTLHKCFVLMTSLVYVFQYQFHKCNGFCLKTCVVDNCMIEQDAMLLTTNFLFSWDFYHINLHIVHFTSSSLHLTLDLVKMTTYCIYAARGIEWNAWNSNAIQHQSLIWTACSTHTAQVGIPHMQQMIWLTVTWPPMPSAIQYTRQPHHSWKSSNIFVLQACHLNVCSASLWKEAPTVCWSISRLSISTTQDLCHEGCPYV